MQRHPETPQPVANRRHRATRPRGQRLTLRCKVTASSAPMGMVLSMHVAIIMNGNSRWAAQRGLPPTAALDEGVATLRNTVGLAANAGVRTLTLYSICTPDCTRPRQEIAADLGVLGSYLRSDAEQCRERSIRINV